MGGEGEREKVEGKGRGGRVKGGKRKGRGKEREGVWAPNVRDRLTPLLDITATRYR